MAAPKEVRFYVAIESIVSELESASPLEEKQMMTLKNFLKEKVIVVFVASCEQMLSVCCFLDTQV